MSETKRLVCVGEAMIELAPVGGNEPPGGAPLYRMGFAGDTLNTAWYARRRLPAGWSVAYHTRLGTDGQSQRMLAFMRDAGLDTATIGRDSDRRPGLYTIELENGERSFSYWRDASAARHLADDAHALADALKGTGGGGAIYLSGITLAILAPAARDTLLRTVERARDAGARIAFDPNLRPALWSDAATMRHAVTRAAGLAHIVLPSFGDERAAFKDADPLATARRYAEAGAAEVAVKNAGGSMAVFADGAVRSVGPFEAVAPVDTTGAGDAFNAAYIAARLLGRDVDVALAEGHALAAQVVRHPGALVAV